MSDDLVKRLRDRGVCSLEHNSCRNDMACEQAADRIEELEAKLAKAVEERDEALNQLDSAKHSVAVLEKRVKTFCDGWGVADKGRIEAETKLAKAVDGLRQCEAEIDDYIRHEYPGDHPVQARYRKRDFDANPARATLAELTGGKDD